MNELFRKEALAHRQKRLAGEVILAAPVSGVVIACVLLAIAVLLISFALAGNYTRRVTVRGTVAPEAGMVRVVAPHDGYVRVLSVREMQSVGSGATLAVVDSSTHTVEGDAGAQMSSLLADEANAASATEQATLTSLQTEQNRTAARRDALLHEKAELRRQDELLLERRRLAEVDVARSEEVARRGFMSARDLDTRRGALIDLDRQGSELRQSILATSREIDDVAAELADFPARIEAARAGAQALRAQVSQRLVENESQREGAVVSPVAGRIAALFVTPGQIVRAGDAVAAVVPRGSELGVELFVPSRAAGFVRTGQHVRLRYDAFPFERFGSAEGIITSVSRSVLMPQELSDRGVDLREPVFRVRVRLRAQSVAAYGERLPLQPGMSLTADIIVDRRSLAQWVLDPIYATARR